MTYASVPFPPIFSGRRPMPGHRSLLRCVTDFFSHRWHQRWSADTPPMAGRRPDDIWAIVTKNMEIYRPMTHRSSDGNRPITFRYPSGLRPIFGRYRAMFGRYWTMFGRYRPISGRYSADCRTVPTCYKHFLCGPPVIFRFSRRHQTHVYIPLIMKHW